MATPGRYEYVNFGNWLFLTILRLWALACAMFFFRRFEAMGKHNIPEGKPVIFASNHQSAFLDPVLIGITCGRKPWYLTRAGVFANNLIRFILRAIHMLPVYRFRDQANLRDANKDTFEECYRILGGNGSLLIFPEGNHGMQRRLRSPLRKGVARIALETLAGPEAPDEIYILPVGITYEHPTRVRTDVLVRYGQPVLAGKFLDSYRENSGESLRQLCLELQHAMEKEVIDIQPASAYDELEEKWQLARLREGDLMERFDRDKKLVKNGKYKPVEERFSVLKLLAAVLGLPFFLAGVLVNLPLYLFVVLFIKWLVKDPHFIQSVKFVLTMTVVPLYALLAGILLHQFINMPELLGSLLVLLAGIVSYDYFDLILRGNKIYHTSKIMGDFVPRH